MAYRAARLSAKQKADPDPSVGGVAWKAHLIVEERFQIDRLATPGQARREAHRLITEIVK